MYKAFIKPHLDYCDILYDQAHNIPFHCLVSIQYNTCFVITGAIQDTSKETLFEELGLESLQSRCWYRKIWNVLHNFQKQNLKTFFFKLVPDKMSSYVATNTDNILLFHIKHNFYEISFLSVNDDWVQQLRF